MRGANPSGRPVREPTAGSAAGGADGANQPERKSRRFSNALIEQTREHFQGRTDRKLTDEDARQMLENLVGFFTVLHEWDRRARSPQTAETQANPDGAPDDPPRRKRSGEPPPG